MTSTVKAVFTGADGSCGYKHGQEYTLKIDHQTHTHIRIEKYPFGGYCDYGSMRFFLQNWNNIRNVVN